MNDTSPQKKTVLPTVLLVLTILFTIVFLAQGWGVGIMDFLLVLVVWLVFLFILWKRLLTLTISAVLFIIIITISFLYINWREDSVLETSNSTDSIIESLTTIVVEGENGILSNEGSYSYLGESSRGEEAYLGDGGAMATYTVDADVAGKYSIELLISDDGLHDSGKRDVTFVVNGTTLQYSHVSEDTKGWKWVSLGSAKLEVGENTITITKDETTSAAFVMDKFKLVLEK